VEYQSAKKKKTTEGILENKTWENGSIEAFTKSSINIHVQ